MQLVVIVVVRLGREDLIHLLHRHNKIVCPSLGFIYAITVISVCQPRQVFAKVDYEVVGRLILFIRRGLHRILQIDTTSVIWTILVPNLIVEYRAYFFFRVDVLAWNTLIIADRAV